MRKSYIILTIILLVLIAVTAVSFTFLRKQADSSKQLQQQDLVPQDKHFAFIADDLQYSSWEEVYIGAKAQGEEMNIIVERFGENLTAGYNKYELMKMAIAAGVSGIIVQGDEGEEIQELIDQATAKDIPVVTFLVDSPMSSRQGFVGIGSYNLGREYGREIIRISTKETGKAVILTDAQTAGSDQSIIYTGVTETLANEGNHLELALTTLAIDNESTFSAEETIRDLFLAPQDLPDIIICLNERDTICAYQAVIDYNKVGEVQVIGYHRSEKILDAIEKNVISATISVDTYLMGASCVSSLDTYIETGYMSEYAAIDAVSINRKNIEEYMGYASEANNQE